MIWLQTKAVIVTRLNTEPCNVQSVIRNTRNIQYWSMFLINLFLLHFTRSN